MRTRSRIACALLAVPAFLIGDTEAAAQSHIRIVSGVSADGAATDAWLAILRRRLSDAEYAATAAIRRTLDPGESAWARLVRSRVPLWQRATPVVAGPYAPVQGPDTLVVVLGNRGASDAFTHDGRTIGFDLAALLAEYGAATESANADRIDRLFRHEYAHVLQRAWLARHPYPADTQLRLALVEIWKEGLGNHHSLSDRWRGEGTDHSTTAARALAELEPRFVARLAAIACATPERAATLKADLSWGRFDRKWGALPPALWLEAEPGDPQQAIRAFVRAGPAGVLDLAARHMPAPLAPAIAEIRAAAALCDSG